MLSKLLFIAALSVSIPVLAQEDAASLKQARFLVNQKSYAASVPVFQKVFAQKEYGRAEYYDAACAAALAGQPELALTWLNKSIDKGWRNITHLKADADFESLHALSGWKLAIDKLQAKLETLEKNYDQALKKELESIYLSDQKTRQSLPGIEKKFGRDSAELKAAWEEIRKNDAINLKRVTEILDSKGWLGPDEVGEEASSTLFLVIQHSDIKEWKKYLPIMRKAVQDKKANPGQLALLEDRYLALGLGKKQIYGSQLRTYQGETKLFPIEDPDHLDERRAAVGLQPMAEYLQYWNITWDLEAYKKSLIEDEKNEQKKDAKK